MILMMIEIQPYLYHLHKNMSAIKAPCHLMLEIRHDRMSITLSMIRDIKS